MDLAWRLKLAFVLGAVGVVGCKTPMFGSTSAPPAATAHGPAPQNAITKAWKSTSNSVASALTIKPKTDPADDPTSLNNPATVSASTHLATGRLLESRQDFVRAQKEYEKAIELEPKNLMALVSLARLHDRQGSPDQAIATYQKALQAHPKSALVHNDLGLCYARKRDLPSAVSMLHKAVEIEPGKANYRNNLATVLVESGRTEEALKHLLAVHAPAEAHYNLAFLLNHRGQADMARRHLAQAVSLDPAFAPAQQMLAQLQGNAAAAIQPQVAAREQATAPPQMDVQPAEISATGGSYDAGPTEDYSSPSDGPSQAAEPIYHIGREGIESSPASGPSLYQPTSHEQPGGPFPGATSFHLDDDGDEEVLVVTHLIYGSDTDAAPRPSGLIDDEPAEELAFPAAETDEPPSDDQPTNVKPVSKLPTLYPIAN